MGFNKPLGLWHGENFECRFYYDTQSATAADEHLHQIIARNIFHHFAAGMHQAAISENRCHADKIIADRAVPETPWPAGIGPEERPDRELFRIRRIDRQPLSVQGKLLL